MVPSWTETLLAAGFPVVGRTRFCIHPQTLTSLLPAVGGTKDISWDKVGALHATHIILDQDENPQVFYDQALAHGLIPIVTHVRSLESAGQGLDLIADNFLNLSGNANLRSWAREYRKFAIANAPLSASPRMDIALQWYQKPTAVITTVLYLIWKAPWMAVSRETFIGDMLTCYGYAIPTFEAPYPQLDLSRYNSKETLLLLSTEPFPFAKNGFDDPEVQAFPRALIDGESFSWFGIRALKHLRKTLA